MADLSDIITSKVRVKVLELFFGNVKEIYHVRGVVRELKEEINAVRRELEKLENAGMLRSENRGNRRYYSLREEYVLYEDILSMVAKTKGLGAQLIANKNKIGKIGYIMFSGSFARRKARRRDD